MWEIPCFIQQQGFFFKLLKGNMELEGKNCPYFINYCYICDPNHLRSPMCTGCLINKRNVL